MKVTNKMQIYRLIYYSKLALHVSGDVFAHHQENLSVFRVSGSIHPGCCYLVSWMGPKHVELTKKNKLTHIDASCCRSQWPRDLRRRSAAACPLRSWVRIPLRHGCLSVVNVVCCQVEISATS